MPVDYHAWTHRPKSQGGTDPVATLEWPWVTLVNNGMTLAGDNAFRESLMDEVYWDPSITPDPTAGGPIPYNIDTVDDGEGNDYLQLTINFEGWYLMELVHEIATSGDGGTTVYFQQEVAQPAGLSFAADANMGRAAPWPATGAEIPQSPRIETVRVIWAGGGGSRIYTPRVKQNTGVNKDVGGHFKVFYMGGLGGSTDNATWSVATI